MRSPGAGDAPFVTDQGNLILDCRFGRLDEQRVLAVLDARDDPLARGLRGIDDLLVFVLVLGPVAGDRVDPEAQLLLVGAPP